MNKLLLESQSKRFQTKQEWVYSTLKDAIQNCTLLPGTRLALDELAGQLNVSRVPVREALLQLQAEGLVDMTPHAGAIVSPISLDSIHELFMILEELEVLSGKAVAEKAPLEEIECLEGSLAGMEDAIRTQDLEKWAQFNTEFHRGISRLSGMPFLQHITEKTLEKWDRLRRRFLVQVLHKRTVQALEEHRAIYAALKERDTKKTEELLRNHNKSALKAYLTYLSEKGPTRQ